MRPILYIGNRNYSSWSLRPWLVLTWGRFDFETRLERLGLGDHPSRSAPHLLAISPSGTVPALHAEGDIIPDSLAISEWAAERVARLWPAEPRARAQARAAACEMHSGFGALRSKLPCNIRRRFEPRPFPDDVLREIARIESLWAVLSDRYGGSGPYLFGSDPTIADAFFTPVATRFRTYGVRLSESAQRYADALLQNPAFREWEAEAEREPFVIDAYELP